MQVSMSKLKSHPYSVATLHRGGGGAQALNMWGEACTCLLHSFPSQPSPGPSNGTRPFGTAVFFMTPLPGDPSQLFPRAP